MHAGLKSDIGLTQLQLTKAVKTIKKLIVAAKIFFVVR